jgi:hypothetical protein
MSPGPLRLVGSWGDGALHFVSYPIPVAATAELRSGGLRLALCDLAHSGTDAPADLDWSAVGSAGTVRIEAKLPPRSVLLLAPAEWVAKHANAEPIPIRLLPGDGADRPPNRAGS